MARKKLRSKRMSVIKRITVDHLYNEINSAAERAAPLFSLYGWTYGEQRTPTHNELVDTITRITDSALDYFYKSDKEYRDAEVCSGRFSVRVKEFEDEVTVRIVLDLGGHSWYKA